MNRILQKVWHEASGAAEHIVVEKVQPLLDKVKPRVLTSLKFRKVVVLCNFQLKPNRLVSGHRST
jgi:hypothetical protein